MNQASSRSTDISSLDALTGGAFTAPTSGERAARVRDWLASEPRIEQMQEVFKELSARDKGAAKPLREKIDEARRAKGKEAAAAEWTQKAQALLAQSKLNIADAMAWQRDAAKAGAPLSREPLASLRAQLAERVKTVEELQHRAQVHREAAVLLAQRFDVLSTKSWKDARAVASALAADVDHWRQEADTLAKDPLWSSLDPKFAPQLDASRVQLATVADAFEAALSQAATAADDREAALPPVPVWADELRAGRGLPSENAPPAKAAGPKVDPARRQAAQQAVQAGLEQLERETAEGHGKASAGAAAALRSTLKTHGKLVDAPLEARVHAALVAAGELEGWQRWSADKVREDLVAKAEALLKRPEGQALGGRKMQETLRGLREQWKQADQGGAANHGLWKRFDEACNEAHKVVEAWLEKVRADAAEHRAHRLALVEEVKSWAEANAQPADLKAHLRALHQFADRWRDAGHVGEKMFAELQPLWNDAFGAARAPLESAQDASVERRKAMIGEAAELGASPMLRIDAVKALQQRWQAEAQSVPIDRRQEQKMWDAFRAPIDEAFNRKTVEREKAAAATSEYDRHVLAASKALAAANASGDAQKIRHAMAQLEAATRGEPVADLAESPAQPVAQPVTKPVATTTSHANTAQPMLPEQIAKEAAELEFSEGAEQAPSPEEIEPAEHAVAPLVPPTADLVAPIGSADASALSDATPEVLTEARPEGLTETGSEDVGAPSGPVTSPETAPTPATEAIEATEANALAEPDALSDGQAQVAEPPKPPPKPVVAVRGDDRPGARRPDTSPVGRGGRPGDRQGDRQGDRGGRGGPGADRGGRSGGNDRADRGRPAGAGPGRGAERDSGRFGDRAPRFEDRGPRLGDAAFRAQRDAVEQAQATLRKLAAQAHGEALAQLIHAWEQRDAEQMPSAQTFGRGVSSAQRGAWSRAIGAEPAASASSVPEALLRLEMAAELPTPAEHLAARRALQLQLLTRRGDPAPAQTWGEDAARVLASQHDAASARRLQNALKNLIRG